MVLGEHQHIMPLSNEIHLVPTIIVLLLEGHTAAVLSTFVPGDDGTATSRTTSRIRTISALASLKVLTSLASIGLERSSLSCLAEAADPMIGRTGTAEDGAALVLACHRRNHDRAPHTVV